MHFGSNRQGSGLIIVLSVLAMLAIMGTTFVTLMRLDVKVSTNYVDDQRCEMLALGALDYFKALLRNDLDRTWGKYVNRTGPVGMIGYNGSPAAVNTNFIPGFGERDYGIPVSSAFWFNMPYAESIDWGNLLGSNTAGNQLQQLSFFGGFTLGPDSRCVPAHTILSSLSTDGRESTNTPESVLWVSRNLCDWGTDHGVVCDGYPGGMCGNQGSAIDFDGDGVARPAPDFTGVGTTQASNWPNLSPFMQQEYSDWYYYYDTASFVLYSGDTYFFPGSTLTNEKTMPKGIFWRWAVKLGVPHGMYIDLNTAGNLDGKDLAYLSNMGGIGLNATQCTDDTSGTAIPGDANWSPSQNLGRIKWLGFPTDSAIYSYGGFPDFYDEVNYAPSQISLERLFDRDYFTAASAYYSSPPDQSPDFNLYLNRAKARQLIAYRLGGDGKPGDGTDRYRPGWRRDGATYYRFATPENPSLGGKSDDCYFGMNEVMEHDHATYNPTTSEIANVLTQSEWRKLRPFVTMWSPDTILRGKIWPEEGSYALRDSTGKTAIQRNATAGDWRDINILKRININIIGADGSATPGVRIPENIAGEDTALKDKWAAKAPLERDRLYYMLRAELDWTTPGDPNGNSHKACQFIASLEDMVDRDQFESLYVAPDGSGNWALGSEKHPVINEAAIYVSNANAPGYVTDTFRIELYNPMENIPWIPDADEAIDLSLYHLRITNNVSLNYSCSLTNMMIFPTVYHNTGEFNTPVGPVSNNHWLGADGIYALDGSAQGNWRPDCSTVIAPNWGWDRVIHLGWQPDAVHLGGWPSAVSTKNCCDGFSIELWKELRGNAAKLPAMTDSMGRQSIMTVDGVNCLCVDRTGNLQIFPVFTQGTQGPGSYAIANSALKNQVDFTTVYRRWDPLNGLYNPTKYTPEDTGGKNGARGQVMWWSGWKPDTCATLGRPNVFYPAWRGKVGTTTRPWSQAEWKTAGGPNILFDACNYSWRGFSRDFKIVDGDLPSIGWLGELMCRNAAQDGPITYCHNLAQEPYTGSGYCGYWRDTSGTYYGQDMLDFAKFDLFRPWCSAGDWTSSAIGPATGLCNPKNLQVLDVFTVWDPSNDGIDNDGDGAVDDEDTGFQPGDKCGPEVRVFGRVDLNNVPRRVLSTVLCDNQWTVQGFEAPTGQKMLRGLKTGRTNRRWSGADTGGSGGSWGPFETIGDILKADCSTYRPAHWMGGGGDGWGSGPVNQTTGDPFCPCEQGFTATQHQAGGDDDGDGCSDERDERDMIFTWAANYLTTRSNVFEMDLQVDISDPPHYPVDANGNRVTLPMSVSKVRSEFARKQLIGILDRSTCLRIGTDSKGNLGPCDFSGPVDIRMLRFSDDQRTY